MLHNVFNSFFLFGTTLDISLAKRYFWTVLYTFLYASGVCFVLFPGFWKRKKTLFLSLVPVKSFQKTFQRKFLGFVTSSRSEVVRSRQNPPSHLPEWERFLTTLAPCSSGRPAYEACCRLETRQKSTNPELGHDRGVGGSFYFTALFWTSSKSSM